MRVVKKSAYRMMQRLRLALTVIVFLAPCYAFSQPSTVTQSARINALYGQFQQHLQISIQPVKACPVQALQQEIAWQSVRVTHWLEQVPVLQRNGDSLCAFLVLSALKPIVTPDQSAYRHWLLTRIQALQQARQWQAALQASSELETGAKDDQRMRGWAICEKANALTRLIQFEKALQAGNEALTIARTVGDRQLEVEAFLVKAYTSRDIYRQVPAKYLPHMQQALTLALSLNDTTRILEAYRGLMYAHIYDESADVDTILGYLEKCLPYMQTRHDGMMWYRLAWALADALSYVPHTQSKASRLYRQLVPLARSLHRKIDQRVLYSYVASIAAGQKRYAEAATFLDSASRLDTPDWEKDHFYQEQAQVQEALGNLTLANQYYQKALAEKERVYLRRNNQSMTGWETRFRTQEKELQIAQEQTRQRWLLGLAALLLLLFGGAILAYVRNRNQLRLLTAQKAIIEQQSRDLQRLDEAKTRFFSNITHEFRTPLTLILSPLESLVDQLPQYPMLKTIQSNANRLLGFINQLLDLSKLDAGMIQPERTQGNLAAFLVQQEDSFRALADHRQVHLSFTTLPPDTDVIFDADKLGKILVNLISNALKFTPAGGEVHVSTELNERELIIEVADTGSGIPADQLTHIFNRFYQIDDANTRRYNGSGIGLALVKELVDVLQGDISVVSEVGKGTRFRVKLPLGDAEPASPISAVFDELPTSATTFFDDVVVPLTTEFAGLSMGASVPLAGEKPLLLVVEDNDDLRGYIAQLFADSCQVVTAVNGYDGLEKAFDQVPDLVITDWMMPRMDGIELCQQLKTDRHTSHIPVLMLTAKTAIESRLNSLAVGADDHIAKPFHPRELQLKVQNWLERQQRLRQHYQQQLAQPTEAPPLPEGDGAFMEKVQHMIDAHLIDSMFGVEQLADQMAMSRRTLHRKMVGLTGLTPVEVIRNHRLRRALPHLKQGKPIADVAFEVGFETPSYFSKCFQELFGQKPSEIEQMGH